MSFPFSEAIAIHHTYQSTAPLFAIIGLLDSLVYLSIRGHIYVQLPGDWEFWEKLASIQLQYNIVDGILFWHFRRENHKQIIEFVDPVQFHAAVASFFDTCC